MKHNKHESDHNQIEVTPDKKQVQKFSSLKLNQMVFNLIQVKSNPFGFAETPEDVSPMM